MLDDDVRRLREVLARHDYTYDRVVALLGPVAYDALGRGEQVPAEMATRGGSALETLVRLFLLGLAEPAASCDFVPDAFVERDGDEVRAALDVRPYAADDAHWWVVSDLGSDVRPLRPDHVLGVGGASVTLAQATVRRPVASALDVGTGCGVQALHLSRHASSVTATDRNPRALWLARATAILNDLSWELVEGDLLEPLGRRRFDLVVANPPFVVGPARDEYAYRDSGLAGDDVSARLVSGLRDVLTDGGVGQVLANWVHVRGHDWRDRVASWLSGVDALVVQREVQDPAEYVATWQRDAGDTSRARAEAWLRWFAENDVEGVGFGIVTVRRTDGTPTVAIEDARQPVVPPLGPAFAAWLDAVEWLRSADLREARLRVRGDVTLEQAAAATGEGWDVVTQAVQQHTGLRWRTEVDPIGVALLAACDGSRPLGEVLAVLAAAYGTDFDALPAVRYWVERGFLIHSLHEPA